MAGYPYGHGQWPPPPTPPQEQPQPPYYHQQYSQQYEYQPPSGTPPVYGGDPYQAPAAQHQPPAGYYGAVQASQAAFDQNSQVSGLGISVDSPGQRSPNAVGGELSWSEAFGTASSAAPPSQPSSHQPYGQPAHSQQYSYHQQPPPRHPPQPPPVQQQPPQQTYPPATYTAPPPSSKANTAYNPEATVGTRESEPEEGELSEDMDDLYEPEEASGSTSNQDAQASNSAPSQVASEENPAQMLLDPAAAGPVSRDASVVDTQEDAFYDEDDDNEPGEVKSSGNGVSVSEDADADDEDMGYSESEPKSVEAAAQERPASYSPQLSLGEIEESDNPGDTQEDLQKDSSDSAAASAAAALLSSSLTDDKVPPNGATANGNQPSSVGATEDALANSLPFSTVDEAKKEAQRAILRLIPYGVNYQTYIDEGFDEKLIQSLFSELGLKAVPTSGLPASPRSTSPSQSVEPAASQPETNGDKDAPKEERKDRIARLLALKASKPTPSPVPKPPAPVATSKPDKPKSERGLMLQQKLEALRQAQEQRAAAAAKAATEATALSQTVPGQQGAVAAAIAGQIADKTAAISAAVPSAPAGGSRQRPVASDFGEFSASAANSLPKRPPPPLQPDPSMVVDISDDSDEDVAMEIDSQADESYLGPTQYNDRRDGGAPLYREQPYGGYGSNNRNGNSYQDGLYSSPRGDRGHAPPVMPAPPTAPASMLARARDDEYTKKMRQIEEMKRKIAEAEARRAQNSSPGSATPQTGGDRTPPVPSNNSGSPFQVERPTLQPMRRITSTGFLSGSDAENGPSAPAEESSIRLPKRTGGPSPSGSQESHREKRMRVASLQLPRVEASLQEKMFKLRLLQERVAALQAEIDEGVAEKRRLTEDIEDLSSGQEEASPERDASTQPSQSQPVDDSQGIVIDLMESDRDSNVTSQPLSSLVQQEEEVGTKEAMEAPSQVISTDAKASEAQSALEETGDQQSDSESDSDSDSASMSDSQDVSDDEGGDIEMLDNESDEADNPDEEGQEQDSTPVVPGGDMGIVDRDAVEELFHNEPQVPQKQQHSTAVVKPARATAKPVAASANTALPGEFVPYESPLQYFESYRFHPQFKALVPGGFRSLTYSGKIQDDIELCPNELFADGCSDPTCRFQHYASIVPKDDQILVELGRSDDYTGDQKARFVDGLKDLLKRCRDNQERDFDKIAEAIIDFRRTFLADNTRVLAHLEGVTV